MAASHLRIYHEPNDESASTALAPPPTNKVTVSLGEILPLLADAVQSRRTWLTDFEDDEVEISSDLHEVILAYQHYRRPGA